MSQAGISPVAKAVRRPATLLLLLWAAIGIPAGLQQGCGRLQVVDSKTGIVRDATPEEAAKMVSEVGMTVAQTAQGAGLGVAVPWITMVTQIAALLAAWSIRPKESAATATASAPTPPATAPPA
jgi:hypothetical protein